MITIIILLILAVITIGTLAGEDGLFAKTKDAVNKSNISQEQENYILKEYTNEIEKYLVGEGKVKLDEVGNTNKTETLKKTKNTEAEDEYGNPITIPAGFYVRTDITKKVSEGIVIEDKNENQYVWIPVGKVKASETKIVEIALDRYTFSNTGIPTSIGENKVDYYQELQTSSYGNTTAISITDFKNSVARNRGYYVARYEASQNSNSKADSQYNKTVWNFVLQADAATACKNIYGENNTNFVTDLMNSYAWDTAIVFIQKCSDKTDYSIQSSLSTTQAIATGTSGDYACHIADMASNCYEWSTETSDYNSYPNVARGGYTFNNIKADKTSSRAIPSSMIAPASGFRSIIYLLN